MVIFKYQVNYIYKIKKIFLFFTFSFLSSEVQSFQIRPFIDIEYHLDSELLPTPKSPLSILNIGTKINYEFNNILLKGEFSYYYIQAWMNTLMILIY